MRKIVKNPLKSFWTRQSERAQAWWDKPVQERRAARQRELISEERQRPWTAATEYRDHPRLDPILTLPRTPLRPVLPGVSPRDTRIVAIKGQPVTVSASVMEMLRDMDNVFRRGPQQVTDWVEVRTQRRMARNQGTVQRQARQAFLEAEELPTEGTDEEAAFIAEQAAYILNRAKHASDPNSADTTTFSKVLA